MSDQFPGIVLNISVSCMNGRNEWLRGPAGTDGYPSGQAQKNDEYSEGHRIFNLINEV